MTLVFDNRTPCDALQYETLDQFGASYHVVVCKLGYVLGPELNELSELSELPEAAPLLFEDEYFGEMHRSGVRMESDLAPYKPRCDVIVNAIACAPGGKPVEQLNVRLLVQRPATPAPLPEAPQSLNPYMAPSEASMQQWRAATELARRTRIPGAMLINKTLTVLGERTLVRQGIGKSWQLTPPQTFTQLPLRYEFAFGGECRINQGDACAQRVSASARLSDAQRADHPDHAAPPAQQAIAHSACEANPLGCGYSQDWFLEATDCRQLAAPRIEYPQHPFSARLFAEIAARSGKQPANLSANQANSLPPVAGFGCIGRAWLPRRQLIGQVEVKPHYEENDYPTLPAEFDFGYWNCAPRDQQCAHLQGDEEFTLSNLHPKQAELRFKLPGQRLYLALGDAMGRIAAKLMVIDTVTIDTEQNRVEVVWRGVISTQAQITDIQLRSAHTPDQQARLQALLALQQEADHGQ